MRIDSEPEAGARLIRCIPAHHHNALVILLRLNDAKPRVMAIGERRAEQQPEGKFAAEHNALRRIERRQCGAVDVVIVEVGLRRRQFDPGVRRK